MNINATNSLDYQTIVARNILEQIRGTNAALYSAIQENMAILSAANGNGMGAVGDEPGILDWLSDSVGSVYGEAKELYALYTASDNTKAAAEAAQAAAEASKAAQMAKLEIARAQQEIARRQQMTAQYETKARLDAEAQKLDQQKSKFNLDGIDPAMIIAGGLGLLLLVVSAKPRRR